MLPRYLKMQISNYLLYCLFENIQSNHAMTNSYKRKEQNTKHETQHYVEQVNPPVTHIGGTFSIQRLDRN